MGDDIMRRVFICSPFRGDMVANVELARKLCLLACLNDAAPFAPHLIYPQFLRDVGAERDAGINAGLAFLRCCDELWCPMGIEPTEGMKYEIAYAKVLALPIVEVVI